MGVNKATGEGDGEAEHASGSHRDSPRSRGKKGKQGNKDKVNEGRREELQGQSQSLLFRL